MTGATLNLAVLKAVNMAASDGKDRRFHLKGVYIEVEREHVTYVATNGHILLVDRQDCEGNDLTGKWIIPSDTIKALKVDKKFPLAVLSAEPQANGFDKLTISIPDENAITFQPLDGPYPEWRLVVPKKYSGKPATFNPMYLATLQKAMQSANGSKEGVPHVAYNGYGPALIRHGESLFGLVMPVRTDDATLPEWFAGE